jgi:hypothetical protein
MAADHRLVPGSAQARLKDRALKKARAAGHSASELVRKGLRVVASRYYSGRRPPAIGLFESTDNKLGDESLLFKDLTFGNHPIIAGREI